MSTDPAKATGGVNPEDEDESLKMKFARMSSNDPDKVCVIDAIKEMKPTEEERLFKAFAIPKVISPPGQCLSPRHCLKPEDPKRHANEKYVTQLSAKDEKFRVVYFMDVNEDQKPFKFGHPPHQQMYIKLKHVLNMYKRERSAKSLKGETTDAERIVVLLKGIEIKKETEASPKCTEKETKTEAPVYVAIVVGNANEVKEFNNSSFEFLKKFDSIKPAMEEYANNHEVLGMQVI